jgi:hypothetical protein
MSTRKPFYTAALALFIFTLGAGAAQAAAAAPVQPSASYSAASLYNLGNSYARDGKSGLAVLNYERARLLAPDDPDLLANLRYVRNTSGLPPAQESWYGRMTGFASANTFFWLGCAGLCIVGASAIVRIRHPHHRAALLASTAVGLSLMIITLCNVAAVSPAMNEAVVMTPEALARVAPASTAESLMALPQAQTVTIEAQRADFVLVHTQAGRTGWVARTDLARVVPQRDE